MSNFMELDPALFELKSISKETTEFNEGVDKLLSSVPPTYTLNPQKIRDDREAGLGLWPIKRLDDFTDKEVSGSAGKVPVRIYTPKKVKAVYLHIHGGGFMLGRAHHQDEGLHAIANNCNVATVSVDYRLAPENPYPAGADDCEAAAVWLIENMNKEFNTDKIIIGGESAGANLAVVTLLRMRDKHGFIDFSGANLVYGVYDQSMTPSARNWGESPNLVLTTKLMQWFHSQYAPADMLKDPDVSPLYADLTHMPPALFSVGTLDPLFDDSLFMNSRWITAGNKGELAIYPGGIHAFNAFPIELARQANSKIGEFVGEKANN